MSAPRVVVSPHNVVSFPEGGGHFWAYMQHVQGLRGIGCDVWWLEALAPGRDRSQDTRRARVLADRLSAHGMRDRLLLYDIADDGTVSWLGRDGENVVRSADLLINFHYAIRPEMLGRFDRTALVDIDPGLLQLWISRGELALAPHDVYFTTGATVGTPEARFPDCGIDWVRIRPAVSLSDWAYARESSHQRFTTVSSWWGDEWIRDHGGEVIENNKRVTFLEFAELPRLVGRRLELALCLGPKDAADMALLEDRGWVIRNTGEVANTPAAYRAYVRGSHGEFSCAKPSCMLLQNAWVSDRTLCYLASGRPAVVQHTGASTDLDGHDGLLRFSTIDEAAAVIDDVTARYEHHRHAARALAEELFDARKVARAILTAAIGSSRAR